MFVDDGSPTPAILGVINLAPAATCNVLPPFAIAGLYSLAASRL
ncbi:hypothetical protein AB4099_14455 [Bosea sp. 2KB_26]